MVAGAHQGKGLHLALTAKVPHGHWKTTTFMAALRYDRIEAPWVLDGPIASQSTSKRFSSRPCSPVTSSSWTISAATKAVRALIRSRGAKLLFLPKYSPDLNPIEQVFAKLKHLLRKAAARTVDAVWDAIGQLLPAFIPKECANYFENAGYAST